MDRQAVVPAGRKRKISSYFQDVTTITIGRLSAVVWILRQMMVWWNEAHEKGKLDNMARLP